jgi:DNA-binding NarL/FixJ family response regulator
VPGKTACSIEPAKSAQFAISRFFLVLTQRQLFISKLISNISEVYLGGIPVRKLRVLVADDHEAMRRALVSVLCLEFTVVSVVADGKSLVDAALVLSPDVIVSDVSMPLSSGPQAIKELNARGCNIPFVLVSIDPTGSEEFVHNGAAAFVSKTDVEQELVWAVRSVWIAYNQGEAQYPAEFTPSSTATVLPRISGPNQDVY